VAPRAIALQLLRARFLVVSQLVDKLWIRIVREMNVHANVKQHG
jgi:hypothetical protein